MLKAASLLGPLLSRSCLARKNLLHRIPTSSPGLQPLWRLRGGTRCIMEGPAGEVSPSVEKAMKARDNIPDDYKIIYRAPHEYYVKVTYMSAAIAVISMPALIAMIYLTGGTNPYPMTFAGITLFETSTDAYLMLGLLALTSFNIANTVAKYPMRIYRNPLENTYIAVFQHAVPGLMKHMTFSAGQLQKGGGWIWKDSTYTINNKKKVLLIDEHFSTPMELVRMTIEPHKDSPVEKHKRRSRMV